MLRLRVAPLRLFFYPLYPMKPDSTEESPRASGGWALLQKPWWFCVTLFRALSPARFSLLVALIGGSLFLFVDQGTEILRSLAERDQDTQRLNPAHIAWFFGALGLWCVQTWYWARLLLSFEPHGVAPPPDDPAQWLIGLGRRQGPRVLGVLPCLGIAYACLFLAPVGYDERISAGGHPKATLRLMGIGALVMAALLYAGFVLSRHLLTKRRAATLAPGERMTEARIWPRFRSVAEFRGESGAVWAVALSACLALALTLVFLFAAVPTGVAIGSGAILCLAASAWVCFGSLAVWGSDRLRLPFIPFLVAWAVFCSLFNDNHLVRMLPEPAPSAAAPMAGAMPKGRMHRRETPADAPVAAAFLRWHDSLPPSPGGQSAQPVFVVATEGGGIRAAYWTALVLGTLQDQSQENAKGWQAAHPGEPAPPEFASHLFAISGVSGGSLGAAVFDALLAEHAPYPLAAKTGYMLRQDYLSPTLAAMLFPDLLQRLWPFPVAAADRAKALEKGWEHGWALTISGEQSANRFAAPFRALWTPEAKETPTAGARLPALFLNGTRVESGKRLITSNLGITGGVGGEFADAEDAEEEIAVGASGPRDLPLSTAAHMSARFTYVSPAGLLPNGGHVVDGGYFENSGAATALEIVYVLEEVIKNHPEWKERLVPVLIEIRNGPTSEPPPEPEGDAKAVATTAVPPKLYRHPELLSEVFDPLVTMLNTRDARGSFSQKTIETEQTTQKDAPLKTLLYKFGLYKSKVPLPLGWMLSGGAAREMQFQLHDPKLTNQGTLDEITGTLLPTAAAGTPTPTPGAP